VPIIRVESSIPLPPQAPYAEALGDVVECMARGLGARRDQVRAAFVAMEPQAVIINDQYGEGGPPWIIGWVYLMAARPEEQRLAFVADMKALLTRLYGVDGRFVFVYTVRLGG
jgi:hypothetical protein